MMWRSYSSLELDGVRRALPRYVDIVKGRRIAKFLIDKAYPAKFSSDDSTEDLNSLHKVLLSEYRYFEEKHNNGMKFITKHPSFLDLKAELARRIMRSCGFCERRCGVDRQFGAKGYCKCGKEFEVASYFIHTGEEPELVPSGTVFTTGCSIRCIHCQNHDISQCEAPGVSLSPERVADIAKRLIDDGCRNLNMVGGEPTPNTWLWLEVLKYIDESVATVWNSNSWYSQETSELLSGFIDLYLLDFKYGNNDCALAISDAPGYWESCTRNHLTAKMHGELIIRILVLPGHNNCCTKPIVEWIAKNLGEWTRVNLMFQYRPEWRARERPELSRRLTRNEIDEALAMAKDAGLKNLV